MRIPDGSGHPGGGAGPPSRAPRDRSPDPGPSWVDAAAIPAVLRRAVELDAHLSPPAGGLDVTALVEVAREVGISEAAVRQAIAELGAGVVEAPGPEGGGLLLSPRRVRVERLVGVGPARVWDELRRWTVDQLLEPRRQWSHGAVWTPRTDLTSRLRRRLRSDVTLRSVTRLVAEVVGTPEAGGRTAVTRIRLAADCEEERERLAVRAVLVAASAAGAGGLAVAVGPEPASLVVASGAAGTGGWALSAIRRRWRRHLEAVALELEGFCDRFPPPAAGAGGREPGPGGPGGPGWISPGA